MKIKGLKMGIIWGQPVSFDLHDEGKRRGKSKPVNRNINKSNVIQYWRIKFNKHFSGSLSLNI